MAKQKIKGGWGASPAAALLLTALAEAVRAVLNIDYTEAAELVAVWAQKNSPADISAELTGLQRGPSNIPGLNTKT